MNVVLVHGIFNSGKIFSNLRHKLQSNGYKCFAPALKPSDGRNGLEKLAITLKNQINERFGENTQLTIIGFSMGGIIARYYIQFLGGNDRVSKLITISTPHYGSFIAYLYPGVGAKQLRPKSKFLVDLNENMASILNLKILSYWTPFDLSIIPSNSSVWEIAEYKKFYSIFHPFMLFSNNVAKEILKDLNEY